ncbi:MAG TPA: PAS domain S-box protein, partial [Rubricoccaceae bacterium]
LDGRPVVVSVNRDVTERNLIARTSAARAAFRETLADALRSLTDPVEVKAVATELLGEYLHASRVHYGEIDDEAYVVVDRDYTDDAVSLVGRFRKEDFNPALARAHDAGKSVVTPDVANAVELSEPDRAAYAAGGVAAQVCVPLVKGERLVAVLAVHQREPRDWTAGEVALIEETAERVWTTLGRARAEAALRESEERYRGIFEQDVAGVVILALDGRVVSANPRFCEIVGHPEAALVGTSIRDFTHPDHVDETLAHFGRLVAEGTPFSLDKRYVRQDGSAVWASSTVALVHDAAGRPLSAVAITVDISEQRQAEDSLRESEERLRKSGEQLRLVSHATNDAIWDWDMRTGRIVTNPAFGDLFGWREEAVTGFDNAWMMERMHPDDQVQAFDMFRTIMTGTESSWASEHRFERADGTWADVLERGYVIRENGVPVRTVGAMLDLSARKETERALVEAKEAAEEVARAKSSLLMNMSHEIRTPLTAVIGYAELLGDECGPEQTAQREYAAAIEQGGRRLLDTLNSVLDLAQIEGGELAVSPEPVDLYAEAARACAAHQPLATDKGLNMRLV